MASWSTVCLLLLSLLPCGPAIPRTNGLPRGRSSDLSDFSDTNLVDLATKVGDTDLVSYINTAGIAQPLSMAGPMTLFGPTNTAFSKLPPDVLKALDTNMTELVNVLLYHVLNEAVTLNDTHNDMLVGTLQGQPVRLNIYDVYRNKIYNGTVTTVCGKVIQTPDLMANNGILHVISGVMFPPSGKILETIRKRPDMTILTKGLIDIDLTDILEGDGPLTLFAPTDTAFNSLPGDTLQRLLTNRTAFQAVLTNHLVPGTYYTAGFMSNKWGAAYTWSLDDQILLLNTTAAYSTVNGIKIDYPDIGITNGVVHVIHAVLMPRHVQTVIKDHEKDASYAPTNATL